MPTLEDIATAGFGALDTVFAGLAGDTAPTEESLTAARNRAGDVLANALDLALAPDDTGTRSGVGYRSCATEPTSWNPETRTCRATILSANPVVRRDGIGMFHEVLDPMQVNPDDVVGLPVVDNHAAASVSKTLGRVTGAGRSSDGSIWADLQISASEPAVGQKIAEGIISGVSVGYDVPRWTERNTAGVRTRVSAALKLNEVSLTAMPADTSCFIRSKEVPLHTNTAAPPTDTSANTSYDRVAVNGQIRSLVKTAGLGAEVADTLIDTGADIETAKGRILDSMLSRSAGRSVAAVQVISDNDSPETVIDRMGTAFAARATERLPEQHRVAMPENCRSYAGRTMLSLAAELADRRGNSIGRYVDPNTMYTRAMTTSDFPNLLANVAHKVLLPAYQNAQPTYRRFFARRDLADYRATSLTRLGDFPVPLAVGENGEYKEGSISDSGQTAQLAHYGRVITLSRQSIVNDDLNGFADLPSKAAIRCADWENAVAWAHIVSNPALADGYSLFDATHHGNAAASGGAISVTTIGAGEAAMMKQTSLDGLKLNLRPEVLAVSPDKLTIARQFVTSITPHQTSDVNPFVGQITVVGDANLSGNAWYLFAEPTALETFNYGYLQGQTGPTITPEQGFDVAGMRLRLAIDFYVQAIDYRGAYLNSGA